MSGWDESFDATPWRMPLIRATAHTVTYEMRILGGVMAGELFVPTPRTRLVLRCYDDGRIVAKLVASREPA